MVLIQNKIDLIDKAVITSEEATALADKVGGPTYVLEPAIPQSHPYPHPSRILTHTPSSFPLVTGTQVGLKFYRTSVKENYNIDEGWVAAEAAARLTVHSVPVSMRAVPQEAQGPRAGGHVAGYRCVSVHACRFHPLTHLAAGGATPAGVCGCECERA